MQGRRSPAESFLETPDSLRPDFDCWSATSTSIMDREFYWNNIFLHPSDTNMSDANIAAEDTSILNTRSSNGSSSSQHFRIGGSPNEEDNILSLEDAEIDLNSNEIDDGQPFSFPLSANRNNEPLDQGHNAAHVGIGGEASESRLFSCPYVPSLLEQDRGLSSSYSDASSSGLNGSMSGDFNDEPGSSLDGRRVTCKRKNTEIFPGSSSASGSANLFHLSGSCPFAPVSNNSSTGINISSPSNYTTGASSSQGQLNTRLSTIIRGAVPNAESSERSFRHRVNPAQQNDFLPPNLYMSRDTVHDSIWAHNEPSFNFISFNRRLESGPVAASSSMQQQPQMSVRPTLPQNANLNPWTSTPSSRNGNSPSSLNSSETWRSIREETVMMNLPRNNILDQPLLVPDRETRGARQEMVANGSAASTAGNSSGIQSSVGSTWVSNQNPPTQLSQNLPRSLADVVQETLLASNGPAGHSATTQGPVDQAASFSPRIQQPQVRSAHLLDRQNDDVPLPLMRLASREGRNRMISEIRNALDVMRRGENLRFEDVFMFDHPLFHGVADLHDRHRDMRLDVDNMSYEELLALEERIGDVNTGLGEETILKSLRQWKHSPVRAGTTADMEPCCICQEEYVEGEDLGALDCRHDFHTACIKPWLMQKNLCPICKTTAVVT